jgi:cytochrome c oxidase subunit 3
MSTMSPTVLEAPPDVARGGGGFDSIDRGGDGGGDRGPAAPRYDKYRTAVWVLLIPVVMLFVGLTSSLIVRKGLGNDWVAIRIPPILWLNTVLLVASSVAFERAKRALGHDPQTFGRWLWITSALGTSFLLGQVIAWWQLVSQGVFLASNPSSSFFYVLTATHGMHLAGGMAALLYLTVRFARHELGPARQSALRATAVYWHFMDVLWVYLLLLLLFWR